MESYQEKDIVFHVSSITDDGKIVQGSANLEFLDRKDNTTNEVEASGRGILRGEYLSDAPCFSHAQRKENSKTHGKRQNHSKKPLEEKREKINEEVKLTQCMDEGKTSPGFESEILQRIPGDTVMHYIALQDGKIEDRWRHASSPRQESTVDFLGTENMSNEWMELLDTDSSTGIRKPFELQEGFKEFVDGIIDSEHIYSEEKGEERILIEGVAEEDICSAMREEEQQATNNKLLVNEEQAMAVIDESSCHVLKSEKDIARVNMASAEEETGNDTIERNEEKHNSGNRKTLEYKKDLVSMQGNGSVEICEGKLKSYNGREIEMKFALKDEPNKASSFDSGQLKSQDKQTIRMLERKIEMLEAAVKNSEKEKKELKETVRKAEIIIFHIQKNLEENDKETAKLRQDLDRHLKECNVKNEKCMWIEECVRVLFQHISNDEVRSQSCRMRDFGHDWQELSDKHIIYETSRLENATPCSYHNISNSDKVDQHSPEITNNNATYFDEINIKHEHDESFNNSCPTVDLNKLTCIASNNEVIKSSCSDHLQDDVVLYKYDNLVKGLFNWEGLERGITKAQINTVKSFTDKMKDCIKTLASKKAHQESFLCKDVAERSKSSRNQFEDIPRSSSDLITTSSSVLPPSIEAIVDEQCNKEWVERVRANVEQKMRKSEAVTNDHISSHGIDMKKNVNISSCCLSENNPENDEDTDIGSQTEQVCLAPGVERQSACVTNGNNCLKSALKTTQHSQKTYYTLDNLKRKTVRFDPGLPAVYSSHNTGSLLMNRIFSHSTESCGEEYLGSSKHEICNSEIGVGHNPCKSVTECPNTTAIDIRSVKMETSFETQDFRSSAISRSERRWKRVSAIKKLLLQKRNGPDSKQHTILRRSQNDLTMPAEQFCARHEIDLSGKDNNNAHKSMETSKRNKTLKKERKTLFKMFRIFEKSSEEKSKVKGEKAKKENDGHNKEQSRGRSKKEYKQKIKNEANKLMSRSKVSPLKEQTLDKNNGRMSTSSNSVQMRTTKLRGQVE